MPRAVKSTSVPGASGRRLRFRWEYLIVAAAMALFTVKFVQKTQDIRGLAVQQQALQAQNQQMAQSNAQLRQDIAYYRTPAYVRARAREVLGYTDPGDVTVQVQMTRPERPVVRSAPPRPAPTPPPAWQRWWSTFFG